MDIAIDREKHNVYVKFRDLTADEKERLGDQGGIGHMLQKHGVLLHWNGRGEMVGIEFDTVLTPITINEVENANSP